ncbi:DUF3536 domain-containing protein [Hyphobacterium sp. CCMP332]|nr:DUF3536 domain-containing protein [Hyphobacterium sp. CCMP332]
MDKKYVCIHGHFYQPPRENAWLEEIELQESAQPYHDWNDRITNECYGPNGVSRILNDKGKITDIVNNYSKINFNFGATLLSWMEHKMPKVYQSIIEADKLSQEHFDGHGSAIAQVYNHIIMPLANRRDKETQVIWGLYDFEQRFGRKSEGIWLAETAVDIETLEVLAENDVKYTILAPSQAKHYRKIGDSKWEKGIDTKRPYKCNLPSGKSIYLFFYDGERSQEVAFKGVLNDGKKFAHRLTDGFHYEKGVELSHIATDGESYGHHHKNGDMALAYCIRYIEDHELATITNYSQFLRLFEVDHEVEIYEDSSWSCAHGVERWRDNCGCNSGMNPGWHQKWRKPLRESLDWLRDELIKSFEELTSEYKIDGWFLRNRYIEVLYKRSPERINLFIEKYVNPELSDIQKTKLIRLLEMQRQALYMFTSCGWFFDEISGIETVQILQYANRAIQLRYDVTKESLDQKFKKLLEKIPSNVVEYDNGKAIYERFVMPKRLSLTQVGMHYAVSSLFQEDNKQLTVLNYDSSSEEYHRFKGGSQVVALGRTKVKSRVTLSNKHFSFAILYLGNHHLIGNASDALNKDEFSGLVIQIKEAFESSNIALVIQLIKDNFRHKSFSFFNLLKDEQHKLLERVLEDKSEEAMASLKKLNSNNYSLMNLMSKSNLKIPDILLKNLETEIDYRLTACLEHNGDLIPIDDLQDSISEVKKWDFKVNTVLLDYLATRKLNKLVEEGKKSFQIPKILKNLWEALPLLNEIGVYPELNELQDIVFRILHKNLYIIGRDAFLFDLAKYINLDLDSVDKEKEDTRVLG